MPLFNVPFLPDRPYIDYLVQQNRQIHGVHYPLFDPTLKDARIELHNENVEYLTTQLKRLPNQKKYLLANGRIHSAELYTNQKAFSQLAIKLESLLKDELLDGIIYADSYMLVAFGKALPSIAANIEAIPSINFNIDTVEKLIPLMELATLSGFKSPSKITIDRELNRKPGKLKQLIQSIKRSYPGTIIEILANEGCLNHCPFRSTHESMISIANLFENCGGYDTYKINSTLACRKTLLEEPYRFLTSPFIRPEDLAKVEQSGVDVIKLCGRTLGSQFLTRCLKAYSDGSYNGNLAAIMDASNWIQNYFHIDNSLLPSDFYEIISSCNSDCIHCGLCQKIFQHASNRQVASLTDFRTI